LLACVAGCLALALVGAFDERRLAFTANVRPVMVVAVAPPGAEACQRGLEAVEEFDMVEARVATGELAGPPLRATVRDLDDSRVLATGAVPAGTRDNRDVAMRLDRKVPSGGLIEVCLRNLGRRGVGFYGGPTDESQGHSAVGRRLGGGDMRVVFLRSEPRSALAQVPDMFERATRFRPDVVGEWTFWLLLVAVAGGIPALLAVALRSASRT
jgi:hypothetical protein